MRGESSASSKPKTPPLEARRLTSIPSRQRVSSFRLGQDILKEALDSLSHCDLGDLPRALIGHSPATTQVLEHGSEGTSSAVSVAEGEKTGRGAALEGLVVVDRVADVGDGGLGGVAFERREEVSSAPRRGRGEQSSRVDGRHVRSDLATILTDPLEARVDG